MVGSFPVGFVYGAMPGPEGRKAFAWLLQAV